MMEKRQENSEKQKFNIYKLWTILLVIVLLAVLGILGRNWIVQRSAEREYEKLMAEVNSFQNQMNDNVIVVPQAVQEPTEAEEPVEETESEESTDDTLTRMGIHPPRKEIDWGKFAELNPDIYAWICIPGTEIDYPVLQHPTDDSYYLKYNMNGTRGYPGCIYTEKINSKDFTDFDTVIYGHNMRNASMFATLHYYEDQEFFANCPYVFIYTEDKVLVYEIFAAYTADDSHILYSNDFSSEEGRQSYLGNIVKYCTTDGNVRQDVTVTTDSHVLTLSTCIKGKSKNRFLVQAVLLNEDEL